MQIYLGVYVLNNFNGFNADVIIQIWDACMLQMYRNGSMHSDSVYGTSVLVYLGAQQWSCASAHFRKGLI